MFFIFQEYCILGLIWNTLQAPRTYKFSGALYLLVT